MLEEGWRPHSPSLDFSRLRDDAGHVICGTGSSRSYHISSPEICQQAAAC